MCTIYAGALEYDFEQKEEKRAAGSMPILLRIGSGIYRFK